MRVGAWCPRVEPPKLVVVKKDDNNSDGEVVERHEVIRCFLVVPLKQTQDNHTQTILLEKLQSGERNPFPQQKKKQQPKKKAPKGPIFGWVA